MTGVAAELTRSVAPEMATTQPDSWASRLPSSSASSASAMLSTPFVMTPTAPATAMISDALPRMTLGLSFTSSSTA